MSRATSPGTARPTTPSNWRSGWKRSGGSANGAPRRGTRTPRGYLDTDVTARIDKPARSKPRERWLSDAEIVQFWQATEQVGHPWEAYLRMLLVCGQRRGETGK